MILPIKGIKTLEDYVGLPCGRSNNNLIYDKNGKLICVVGKHNIEAMEIDKSSLHNYVNHKSDEILWLKCQKRVMGWAHWMEIYLNSEFADDDICIRDVIIAHRFVGIPD